MKKQKNVTHQDYSYPLNAVSGARAYMNALHTSELHPALAYTRYNISPSNSGNWEDAQTVIDKMKLREEFPF